MSLRSTAVRRVAVHQFHPGCAFGDGVTNGMLFTRGLLRELGFHSEIYCAEIPPEMRGEIRPAAEFAERPEDILLVHHSFGHGYGAWIELLRCRLVLVYHNVTPEAFFPDGSEGQRMSRLGRAQLPLWRDRFEAAIGDSVLNTQELAGLGYTKLEAIPLLVDVEAVRAGPVNERLLADMASAQPLLFVGGIARHKCQHDVIEVLAQYRRLTDRFAYALLVGGISDPAYRAELDAQIARTGLDGLVILTGKAPVADLNALFRGAAHYVSMSEHEGFGMPLIEAMLNDLPVTAFDSSGVADTLGGAGNLVRTKDPAEIAALLIEIDNDPERRAAIIAGQRRNIARFERPVLAAKLESFLWRLGAE